MSPVTGRPPDARCDRRQRSGRLLGGESGFTLVEIIIVLIIAAVAGTMLFTIMGNNVVRSHLPVTWTREEFTAYETMEQITADYRAALKNPPFSLAEFKAHVESDYGASGAFTDFQCSGGNCLETGIDGNILKVTVQHENQKATSLFTQ